MPIPLSAARGDLCNLDSLPDALGAYNVCLALEKEAITDESRMHARILGYLILHAPSSTALAEIARAIHSCGQDEKKLLDLGESFLLWFIRPFKQSRGWTPASSDHTGRRSFDRVKEDLRATAKEVPKDYRQAKTQALVRDGYKCAVTGKYDVIAGSLVDVKVILAAGGTVHTELAHILPESTYFDISINGASSPEKDHSASVFAILQHFGYDVQRVNGTKVHSLYNIMTMEKNVHDWFDRLEMWFESTGIANCYHVQTTQRFYQVPSEVTFTSSDPLTLPYPSQQFLALHATCAKVAHLSGAGEYIDKFDRDIDDLDVLATDGSSSAVLTHALLKSMLDPVSNVT